MSSSFSGIEIGKRSLFAQSQSINTAGHNISNADTEGYSRQRVNISSFSPLYRPDLTRAETPGQIGQGATVQNIERVRDELLEKRIVAQTNQERYWKTRDEYYVMIEGVYNEPADISIRTNMDKFWQSWQELSLYPESKTARQAIVTRGETLVNSIQQRHNSLAGIGNIINGDIDQYEEICKDLPCRVITFGKTPSCNYYPTDITYNKLGHISAKVHSHLGDTFALELSVPGEHNLTNALAAMALADYLGIDRTVALSALRVFKGSKRRFEYKGSLGSIDIIDDYAHHPTEITATLSAAQNFPHGRVWCVFQPHTFTRTKAFMDEFATALSLADEIILADIYPARETDNLGISSRDLQAQIQKLGKHAHYLSSFDAIENFLLENLIHNDMVITMGAEIL